MSVNKTILDAVESLVNSKMTVEEFIGEVGTKKRAFQLACQLGFDYMNGTHDEYIREVLNRIMPVGWKVPSDDCAAAEYTNALSVLYDTCWTNGQTDLLAELQNQMLVVAKTIMHERGTATAEGQTAAIAAASDKLPELLLPRTATAIITAYTTILAEDKQRSPNETIVCVLLRYLEEIQ